MNQNQQIYHKLFTPKEANRSLILVSKIVEDINKTLNTIQIQKAKISTQNQNNIPEEEINQLKINAENLIKFYGELESLGIILVNPNPIVLGFPTSSQSNQIDLLTWRPGQIEVKIPHLT